MGLRRSARAPMLLLLAGVAAGGFSLTFTHLAGSAGGAGFEDGSATAARFRDAAGVVADSGGNVYVADTTNHTIRRISPSGEVTTFAGLSETPGYADGYRAHARFHYPRGLAIDGGGNLYVADSLNHAIRKIAPDGLVSTLAGFPAEGFTNATGAAARFRFPTDVALDASGTVYVADTNNHAIRQITAAGVVTTLAGSGSAGDIDATGTAASFDTPRGLAWDATTGSLFIADTNNALIRQVTVPGAVVTTFAGTPEELSAPWGIEADASGTLYVADAGYHRVVSVSGGGIIGEVAGLKAYPGPQDGGGMNGRFRSPTAVALFSTQLYVADSGNHTVRQIELSAGSNIVTTFAGVANASGFVNATGADARFSTPTGISFYPGPAGYAYVADRDNHAIRKVTVDGVVTTLAGGTAGYLNANGTSAQFLSPQGVAVGSSGVTAYVADTGNHCIRFINGSGDVTLYAGQPGSPGLADGDRLTTAQFTSPREIAVGPSALYVIDTHLRRIDFDTGAVSTLMAVEFRSDIRTGLAVDASDNVYLTTSGFVLKRTPDGTVSVVSGGCCDGPLDGTGTAARFAYPGPGAIAGGWPTTGGGSWVLDPLAHQVRFVDFGTGQVTTAGGKTGSPLAAYTAHANYGTSPGTGTFSRFHSPRSAAAGFTSMILTEGHTIRYGGPEIADRAVIDSASGPVGQARQLDTSPQTATSWSWSIIRRPSGSTATLSATNVRNPTFTPDIADLYVFRCVATSSSGSSISTVTLQGSSTTVDLDLQVGYPGPVIANSPFEIIVSANDAFGNLADSYAGTVHFSSSDPAATLVSDYTFTTADHGRRSFDVTLRTPGSQTITVTDVSDGSLVATVMVTVVLPAPANLVATATGPTTIDLSWSASYGAATYDIAPWDGAAYTPSISGVSGTSYSFTAESGKAYAFRVRAVDGSSTHTSGYSNADVATTIFFSGGPLSAGTPILLLHLTEAREAVDAVRQTAVVSPLTYTDASPAAGVTPIRAAHIAELRNGLTEALLKFGIPSPAFTDPTLSTAITVKAVHMQEIRDGVR